MSDQAIVDHELAQHLVDRAKAEGVKLTGPGGLLGGDTCAAAGPLLLVSNLSAIRPRTKRNSALQGNTRQHDRPLKSSTDLV